MVSLVVHCVCTVLRFNETSKTILTFGVAADGFERQGSQGFIFGPLHKPFIRGRSIFMLLEGVCSDICLLYIGPFFSNRDKDLQICSTDEYCHLANFGPAYSFPYQVMKDLIPIFGPFCSPHNAFGWGLALFTLLNDVFSVYFAIT